MVCLTCDDDCIHIVVDNLVSLDQGHATQGCRNPKDLHVKKKTRDTSTKYEKTKGNLRRNWEGSAQANLCSQNGS